MCFGYGQEGRRRGLWPGRISSSVLPAGITAEKDAHDLILANKAADGLWTTGLEFEREPLLTSLPTGLKSPKLAVTDCSNFIALPQGLWACDVTISKCPRFSRIPAAVTIRNLTLVDCSADIQIGNGAALESLRLERCAGTLSFPERFTLNRFVWEGSTFACLPEGLRVSELNLSNSRRLVRLKAHLELTWLTLCNCRALEILPNQLRAKSLDLTGCTRLVWQDEALVEVSSLVLADCTQVVELPDWLFFDSIDVANTRLTELPSHCAASKILWRGVEVDQRVAFHPELITAQEILAERNAELRRVMLERIGWEKFLHDSNPKVIDQDIDAGGDRRLLAVTFSNAEEIFILTLNCPSTGRKYAIRVPPWMKTCHQSAAWMAGFENPAEYEPGIET
jgi:hypothetical protein